jgi:Skp family chaperone for outer membrane proteins
MADIKIIANLVGEAERHAESQSKDRIRATEYYQGTMADTPSDKGKSSMVTRDVRANIKRVLPSIVRTILNADEVVEFMPVGEGDEEAAKQASDYINYVVIPESDGRNAIYDAIHDALLHRNGVIKWWFEEKKTAAFSSHSGLTEDAVLQLIGEDGVEVVERSERQETVEEGGQQQVVTVYDCKIKRAITSRKTRIAAVPRERFLIHPDAVTLDDSILTGEKTTMRKSDLVAMGYDFELIRDLPTADEDDTERDIRRDNITREAEETGPNSEVDYYDLFVRIDMDGDGIAELHHMCFAGGLTERHLLSDEECDEVQFTDICVMRQPHQWEAVSLADDLMDLQRVKTVLLRQTLDNIYWQNNPQPTVQEGVVSNMDAVMNPEFGLPIRVRQGVDVRAALGFNQVPFVASNSFAMMEYMDKEAQDRTGVSDASAGLAPDALQNMTAKASAMIEQAGIGQTELMVKTAADGLKRLFRGLLRMIIRHQDIPRTVRLRNKWVQVDPRDWNSEMDCTVNTGLGAGTRERDMMMMQQIMAMQEKMIMAFGPDNPFVKPDQVYNATVRMVEAAGVKNPSMFFTDPNPEEVQAKLDAAKNAPDPNAQKMQATMQIEQAKMQANMQVEQAKLQSTMQLEQAKMQASTQKEAAQMEADLAVKQAERETQLMLASQELAFKREELAANQRLEFTKLGMSQSEDGSPVDARGNEMMQVLQQVSAMVGAVSDQLQGAQRPKRIVRDGNGDIIGLEPYDAAVN